MVLDRSGARRTASMVPSMVCSHSCAYTIQGCPDGSTCSVPSRVMSCSGGVGREGSTTVKGPSSESDTAVIVPRMWFAIWNGVPHWLGGATGSGWSRVVQRGQQVVPAPPFVHLRRPSAVGRPEFPLLGGQEDHDRAYP